MSLFQVFAIACRHNIQAVLFNNAIAVHNRYNELCSFEFPDACEISLRGNPLRRNCL